MVKMNKQLLALLVLIGLHTINALNIKIGLSGGAKCFNFKCRRNTTTINYPGAPAPSCVCKNPSLNFVAPCYNYFYYTVMGYINSLGFGVTVALVWSQDYDADLQLRVQQPDGTIFPEPGPIPGTVIYQNNTNIFQLGVKVDKIDWYVPAPSGDYVVEVQCISAAQPTPFTIFINQGNNVIEVNSIIACDEPNRWYKYYGFTSPIVL